MYVMYYSAAWCHQRTVGIPAGGGRADTPAGGGQVRIPAGATPRMGIHAHAVGEGGHWGGSSALGIGEHKIPGGVERERERERERSGEK